MTATDPELSRRSRRAGLTLVELVVVLVILVALASIVIPRADTAAEQGRIDATNATLGRLREVIVNRYVPDTKGVAFTGIPYVGAPDESINYDGLPRVDSINMPPWMSALFLDPGLPLYNTSSHSGWNGPYIASGTGAYPGANPSTAATRGFGPAFGNVGDPTVLDAWGNPVVMVPIQDMTYSSSSSPYVQYYYALISAGPSGMLGLAVTNYGTPSSSSATASTQYPSSNGTSIWAVSTPIQATITIDTTGYNGNAPTGARVLAVSSTSSTSSAELYPYWIPLQ